MKRTAKRKAAKPRIRFYYGAKISEYQFKRVLWHFTIDDSAREAARHIELSATSVASIYTKLRGFFVRHGLFHDMYEGRPRSEGLAVPGYEDVEEVVLALHLKRASRKRGQILTTDRTPDPHFSESTWRFYYEPLMREGRQELAFRIMYASLLQFVRRSGPWARRRP